MPRTACYFSWSRGLKRQVPGGCGLDRDSSTWAGYPGSEGLTSVIFFNATKLSGYPRQLSPGEWVSGAPQTGSAENSTMVFKFER